MTATAHEGDHGLAKAQPQPARKQASHTASYAHGRDLLQLLNRRKWVVIVTLLMFLMATVGGTLIWQLYAPIYTASALVRVNPPRTGELGGGTPNYDKAYMDRLIQTYAQTFKSHDVLSLAVLDEKVKATQWYLKTPDYKRVEQLEKDLYVAPLTNTNYIKLSMSDVIRGEKTAEISVIIDKVAEIAVNQVKKTSESVLLEQQRSLQSKKTDLETLIRENREKLASQAVNEGKWKEDQLAQKLKLDELTKQKIQLEATKAQIAMASRAILAQDDKELTRSVSILNAVENDQTLASLKYKLWQLSMELDRSQKKFGPNHRYVLDVKEQISSLQQEIDDKQARVVAILIRAMREAARENVEAYARDEKRLTDGIQECASNLDALVTNLANLQKERFAVDAVQNDLNVINRRLIELDVLLKQESPLVLEMRAIQPKQPTWPKWELMIPMGLILGIVAGIGLAYLRDSIDKYVRTPSDISRRVDLPLLGMVPHADDIEDQFKDIRKAFLTGSDSLISESFRRIRTCLIFASPLEQQRSLLITSAMPEDGRSTVAVNLASALAQGGRRILLIDANFSQPIMKKLFPQCPEDGLSAAMAGQMNWQDVVLEVAPNLSVMSSGNMPADAMGLFTSGLLQRLVDEMASFYDQIIFDGAPCMVVSDAQALSAVVSGVVLVVRAGVNTYGLIQRMRDTLQRLGANLVGVVLNAARFTPGGYFRESYKAFYEYQERNIPVHSEK
ncbi:MAG: polysaccharide biosynthesis tyrosine autokinase [Planctomycetes bacterium]|nr:polysaccharide biosynthesis tyrosine autokinase [Planctomycetota bacterium]